MKIRVLSDLHCDINERTPLKLKNNDVFTVVCGDTSGDPTESIKWIKKNVKKGLCICGNHLVYNSRKKTIQDLREQLHKAFPLDSNITYLDVCCGVVSKEVDGVLFVGSCFYTDYKLPVDSEFVKRRYSGDQVLFNKVMCGQRMNDFRWGIKSRKRYKVTDHNKWIKEHDPYGLRGLAVPSHDDVIERIKPDDYLEWHNKTAAEFERVISENESSDNPKPVVVLTHHCPLKQCISSTYRDSDVNASYASDYEDFIQKHKSIMCWCCGHVHHQQIIELSRDDGSRCSVILNPRGYVPRCEDYDFNPNTFIDTDTWKVTVEPQSEEDKKAKDKRMKNFLVASSCFI